ncbi:hypothetical protein HMPREF3193_00455 [Bifidobacterium breve]|nr:hypothetical protein HMPREF3193_00455 [Bifidobacterium breve]
MHRIRHGTVTELVNKLFTKYNLHIDENQARQYRVVHHRTV